MGSVVSSIFGGGKPKPAPVALPKPKIAPKTDEKGAKRASQMATSRKYGAAGRTGTILSEGSTLG